LNGGTIQDGGLLSFYFQKFGKNQPIKIFPFCKMIFMKKYSYFLEKKEVEEKSKMASKNQDGVGRFFLNKNSTETPSCGFLRKQFLMRICW
jgi:hypothetical protein